MQRILTVAALAVLCCAACATVEKVPTDARLAEAQKAFDEGQRLKEARQYAEALPLVERALELREAVLGKKHSDVARCLYLLGDVYRQQRDYPRAEFFLQRALGVQEVVLGNNHPEVAASLQQLATLFSVQARYAQAEPLFLRALAIREAVLGKNHPDVARTLNNLAIQYKEQGLYSQAESLYERALAIRESVLGRSHPDVAQSLNNLADLYQQLARYQQAQPLFQRSLAIWETAFGKNHPLVAQSLNNLADIYQRQGEYHRAEPLYERALAIRKATLGENHPDFAQSLNNLANLYRDLGLYARAEPLFERALAVREVTLGKNHPVCGETLNNLARIRREQGLYAQAESLYERALAIMEGALGKKHLSVATVLNGLANVYYHQGVYERAASLHERALAISEEAVGKSHLSIVISLNNLAAVYASQGNYSRAELLLQRTLAIAEETLGKNHPDINYPLSNLAGLYYHQGLYEQAKPLDERALAVQESALGINHPDVAASLNDLATLHLAQGHLTEALPLLERAFTISEAHLRQEVFGYSEVRLASVLHLLRADEERIYSLVRAYPGDSRVRHLAFTAALLRKGRSVEEISDTSRIVYRGLEQADRETFERLRGLRTQLSNLSLAGPGTLSAGDYQQRLKELADQGDALEAELARRSEPLRALHALPPPSELIDRVAATLPRNGVLIEFVAYRDNPLIPKPGSAPTQSPGELHYLALLLFGDGRTSAIDLGLAAPIDGAALRLHAALVDRSTSYQPIAQELYTRALRPVVSSLGKVRRLFVASDGQLALVPFAALHDGRKFLVDTFDITYLTSGKDLLPRPEDSSPASSVVVLADPDFGSAPTATAPAADTAPAPTERSASLEEFFSTPRSSAIDRSWPALPGTRKEAEAIQRLLPQAQLLLGSAATKEALLKLSTPGLLHIATHGFFLEDASSPASSGSRAVKNFGVLGDTGPHRSPDPLLRSGLVLAGAQAPDGQPGSRREDSLVTALELAGLDLWGTQLVVLSACDTGRGDVKLGQGVYGLRRALMVAGTETLVTSLWKVNDETTRELMEGYYGNLLAGQGRTAALREAMRALRQKQPHPHFWAPFVAIGRDAPLRGMVPSTVTRPIP